MSAGKLGRQISLYRDLWQAFEAEGQYDRLLDLYNETVVIKGQLEEILSGIEMTRAITGADYGSD